MSRQTMPPPTGSLPLLTAYDDDDDEDESTNNEDGPVVEQTEEIPIEQDEQVMAESPELADAAGRGAVDDSEIWSGPRPKRQRSSSSGRGGNHANFDISDEEGGGVEDDDDEDDDGSNPEAPAPTATSAPSSSKPSARFEQQPRLSKVSSLVNYGLGPNESDSEKDEDNDNDAGDDGANVDEQAEDAAIGEAKLEAKESQLESGVAVESEHQDEQRRDANKVLTVQDDDGDSAGSTADAQAEDSDELQRASARAKADRLLQSLDAGSSTAVGDEAAGAGCAPGVPSSPLMLPPPPKEPPNRAVQEKVYQLLERKRQGVGVSMMNRITNNKQYRNPSMYEKFINYQGIDDKGTNFHPSVFDPYIWDKHSYYDALLQVQMEAEAKRVRATGNREPQGLQGQQQPPPLMQMASKRPASAVGGGADAASVAAAMLARRSSKWDSSGTGSQASAGAAVGTSVSGVGAFIRRKP